MQALEELEKDQERGWPLRRVLFVRAVEQKYFELERDENAEINDLAVRIINAKTEAHKRALDQFRLERGE